MPRRTYIKVSGTWKQVSNIWRRTGGIWQSGVISYRKIGSDWKQCIAYAPPVPTGLGLTQPIFGDYIRAFWNTSAGATGYILQRKPYWGGSSWVNSWTTVHTGISNTFDDHVDADSPDDGQQFDYQVCAYNAEATSAYSATESILWYMS